MSECQAREANPARCFQIGTSRPCHQRDSWDPRSQVCRPRTGRHRQSRYPLSARDVTGYRAPMPGPLPRNGVKALSDAERAASYRERRKAELEAKVPVRVRYRRAPDKRSRPQRWRDAVAELVDLQDEYAAWLDRLPESLQETPTADALRAIAAFDMSELEALEPPKGFGRD